MFYILTKDNCSWCEKAKELITDLGETYKELNIKDSPIVVLLVKKAGLTTVPQIWVDTPDGKEYVGGGLELIEWIKESQVND